MIRQILFISVYIAVPLLSSLLFRNKYNLRGLTFLITAILIGCYPFLMASLTKEQYKLEGGGYCGTAHMAFFLVNTALLLPLSLIIQFITNRFIIKKPLIAE